MVGGLEKGQKYEFEVTAVVLVDGVEIDGPRSDTGAVANEGNQKSTCSDTQIVA